MSEDRDDDAEADEADEDDEDDGERVLVTTEGTDFTDGNHAGKSCFYIQRHVISVPNMRAN